MIDVEDSEILVSFVLSVSWDTHRCVLLVQKGEMHCDLRPLLLESKKECLLGIPELGIHNSSFNSQHIVSILSNERSEEFSYPLRPILMVSVPWD
jgi:hypothetical protein